MSYTPANIAADMAEALGDCRLVLGSTWSYRTRTSAESASTPTFSAWAETTAHATNPSPADLQQISSSLTLTELYALRVDSAIALGAGDQVKNAAAATEADAWHVIGVLSRGPGGDRLAIGRAEDVAHTADTADGERLLR